MTISVNKKPPRRWFFYACILEDLRSSNVAKRILKHHKNKNPQRVSDEGFWNLILTMTYSHMGKPHTTIGDTSFHC
ncbi:hypothetical protein ALP50_102105 [Pseudomonas syringae pv. spinaceae]|uniref:Uncharacterized protein n=7 Tax=Pseudomonas syringae group TaxID=136849 RepID=A0A0Q0BYA1_PSESX|nr:hypothetical protein ALO94_100525 [Pseudomonas syringae pv. spinaceae]RMT28746.1 hypothetical protein ALP50_102105 [Pseudomonas syringae pv. spinaceae]